MSGGDMSLDDYEKRSRDAASVAISKGHVDAANLRELLIWTTSGTTEPMVSEYFSRHLDDEQLLSALFKIALEGEDSGDAPWAAANIIAEFPATLLARHKPELHALADEQWDYLNRPARAALAKLGV
jgi:hypothetical protein